MRLKGMIMLAVAVAIAAAVSTLAGASAAARSGSAGPPAPVKVNLHNAMVRQVPGVRPGKVSGIVRPVGSRPKAGPIAAACTEPNCDLVYQGGDVQLHPHVYLLLWGPNWTSSNPAFADMYFMFKGLGVTKDDAWSTITSQYGCSCGNPSFGTSVLVGAFQDMSAPPATVTIADLAAEADSFATSENITDLTDAQIVVASQQGTCFSTEVGGFAGSCGTQNPSAGYCAWHSSSNEPFTNMPYQLDAGDLCGENFVNAGSTGTYDGFSLSAGHEYAESITDPFPDTGWIDTADNVSGGEVADKCVNDARNLTLTTGRFAMQDLWSNAAGGCVFSNDRVSVTGPGSQTGVTGTAVSLQLHATSSTGAALTFRASGLPAGLSISAAGLITGKPGITAGTYRPKVTASDANGAAESVSFAWAVRSPTGAVKGLAGKCVDDFRRRTANGNRIDLNACIGRNPQRVSMLANGELTLEAKCIRNVSGRAVLWSCGTSAETWKRNTSAEYVNSGKCLTAPSATNGRQLTLARCTDSTRQRWSLP